MTKPKRKKTSSGLQRGNGLNESTGSENTPVKKARYVETLQDEGERVTHSINDRLAAMEERMEENEGALFEMLEENKRLREELNRVQRENDALRDEVREVRHLGRLASVKTEQIEAWGRKWNLRIWGITGDSLGESAEECIERTLSFIRLQLGLFRFPRDAIEIAHRLGRYSTNQHRTIIVRFMRRTDRAIVLSKRRELRGTPYRMTDDLTAAAARILQRAQAAAGRNNTWTRDGDVIVRLSNGRTMKVEEGTPLEEFFDGSPDQKTRNTGWTDGGGRRHFRGRGGRIRGGAPGPLPAFQHTSAPFLPSSFPPPPPPPPLPEPGSSQPRPSRPPARPERETQATRKTPQQTQNRLQYTRRSASADPRSITYGDIGQDSNSLRRNAEMPPGWRRTPGYRHTASLTEAIPKPPAENKHF